MFLQVFWSALILLVVVAPQAAVAQDDLQVKFTLSGKSLNCFGQNSAAYLSAINEFSFIVPGDCPYGISQDLPNILVAEGPDVSNDLPVSATLAEDSYIFLTQAEFRCLLEQAENLTLQDTALYIFLPQSCNLALIG